MSYEAEISALEAEWSPDDGLFWKLRQGGFVPGDFERALRTVSAIRITENVLPTRLVSLLWYIPLFMHWQVERIVEAQGDARAYRTAVNRMMAAIEQLLGVP